MVYGNLAYEQWHVLKQADYLVVTFIVFAQHTNWGQRFLLIHSFNFHDVKSCQGRIYILVWVCWLAHCADSALQPQSLQQLPCMEAFSYVDLSRLFRLFYILKQEKACQGEYAAPMHTMFGVTDEV